MDIICFTYMSECGIAVFLFLNLCDILARDAIVAFKMGVSVDRRAWFQAFSVPFRNGNSSSTWACSLVCCFLRPPLDCSPPGSSVHGILQAKIVEQVAMPSSGGTSLPQDRTHIPYGFCIDRWVLPR